MMKFCPNCGEKRGFEEHICSQCGFDYREKNVTGGSATRATNLAVPLPNVFEAFKEARSAKRKTYMSAFFAILITSLIAAYTMPGGKNMLFMIGMFGFFIFFAIFRVQLNNKEYYAIQGTQDAEGNHVCASCGHHGIYRKGEYKTNNVECRCSKCGEILFKE